MIQFIWDKLTKRWFNGVRARDFELWDRYERGVILDVWNNGRNGRKDLSLLWRDMEGNVFYGRPYTGVITEDHSPTWLYTIQDPTRHPPYVVYRNIKTRSDALRAFREIRRAGYQ